MLDGLMGGDQRVFAVGEVEWRGVEWSDENGVLGFESFSGWYGTVIGEWSISVANQKTFEAISGSQ